jgi:hypothetical protein
MYMEDYRHSGSLMIFKSIFRSIKVSYAIVAFLIIASTYLALNCASSPTVDSDEVLDQLRMHLPSPIIHERIGSINIALVEDDISVAWLAQNQAIYPFPTGDQSGNLIYYSAFNSTSSMWTSTALPLSSYTIKERLRVKQSFNGDVMFFWTENDFLMRCTLSNGNVHDLNQITDYQITDYGLVSDGNRIEVFTVSFNDSSIHWYKIEDGEIEDTHIYSPSASRTITKISVLKLGGNRILLFAEHDGSSGAYELSSLLLSGTSILDEVELEILSFVPTDHLLVRKGQSALAVVYKSVAGNVSVMTLEVNGQELTVLSTPIEISLQSRIDQLQCFESSGKLEIFSKSSVVYVGYKTLEYRLDLTSGQLTGPINITPPNLSPNEETFAVYVGPGKTTLAVSGLYMTEGGMSRKDYSKLILLERTDADFTSVAILNPRTNTLPEVMDLASVSSATGEQWVTVTTDSNGTSEVNMFQVDPMGTGEVKWMGSSPWYSTHSYSDPRLMDGIHGEVIICRSYWGTGDVPVVFQALQLNRTNYQLTELYEVDYDFINRITYNTWDSCILSNGTIVISGRSDQRALEFIFVEWGSWTRSIVGPVTVSDDIRDHFIFPVENRIHLFTFEKATDKTEGRIRELSFSGSRISLVQSWTIFSGGYYDYESLKALRIGSSEIAIIAKRWYDYSDSFSLFIFDQATGTLGTKIDVQLPKDYYLYGSGVRAFGNDTIVLSTWGLDISTLVHEGKYLLDLVMVMIDRTDPTQQDSLIPLAVSSGSKAVITNEPDLAIFSGTPTPVTFVFTMFEVDEEAMSLFSISYDPLEPGLTPISPPDGAIVNETTIEFSATPIGDILESATEYQVIIYQASRYEEPFASSLWYSYPSIDVTLPEGEYQWTYVYKRTHIIRRQDWRRSLIIDMTPPTPDNGGPYLNASIDTPMFLNGSKSWDKYGITAYRWTVLVNPPFTGEGASPLMEYTPSITGNTRVELTVVDAAGNRASAMTIIIVKPQSPIIDVELPEHAYEGEETTFSCEVSNQHEGVDYTYIWNFGFTGGVGSSSKVLFPNDGNYSVRVEVWDTYGQYSNWEGTIDVINKAPEMEDFPEITGNEFEPILLFGKAHDVEADTLVFKWFLDDVEMSVGLNLELILDNGIYDVTLVAEDDSGANASTSTTITISPTISDILLQVTYDSKEKEYVIKWYHEYQPDYDSVEVFIYKDMDGNHVLWNQSLISQDVTLVRISAKNLPDTIYAQAILRDNSLERESEIIEVHGPTAPESTTNQSWPILIIILLSIVIALVIISTFSRKNKNE